MRVISSLLLCATFVVVTAQAASAATDREGLLYDLRGVYFPMNGTKHVVAVKFIQPKGQTVEQRFTFSMRGGQPQPVFPLLEDEEAMNIVMATRDAKVRFTVDGVERAVVRLSDIVARDIEIRATRKEIVDRFDVSDAPATSHGRRIASQWSGCPSSDVGPCQDARDQCDLYCDPQDPYNLCTRCYTEYMECVDGTATGSWSTDTLLSTTYPTQPVCDIAMYHTNDTYTVRVEHWRHVDYTQYYCPMSGYYTETTNAYNYDVECFHFVFTAAGCPHPLVNITCTY